MGTSSLIEGILEPLTSGLDAARARQVLDYRFPAETQARVDYLGDRASEGLLTPEERAEYEAIIRASHLVTILKLKAQRRLAVAP
jgi:hypothetical protein